MLRVVGNQCVQQGHRNVCARMWVSQVSSLHNQLAATADAEHHKPSLAPSPRVHESLAFSPPRTTRNAGVVSLRPKAFPPRADVFAPRSLAMLLSQVNCCCETGEILYSWVQKREFRVSHNCVCTKLYVKTICEKLAV